MTISVAIAGASGYSGAELIRLVSAHPEFELKHIYAQANASQQLASVHSQFAGLDLEFLPIEDISKYETDLVFLALPSGVGGKLVIEEKIAGRIVDLSGDFRLENKSHWDQFYSGNYFGSWTYGLAELKDQRSKIQKANRIANPGCYATAASLALIPATSSQIIESKTINIVAASGTTGAGRSAKIELLNSEANNNLSSYKVGGIHQHIPEIEQVLNSTSAKSFQVSFTPFLAPMPRGILLSASFSTELSLEKLREVYEDYYLDEFFISILPEDKSPQTKAVLASNAAQLGVYKDDRLGIGQIVVAIDNLGKGAAGQAIQNANLTFGLSEKIALTNIGIGA
jgi:N-acetyl-gamma-glutamyl-phosphate reductase